MAYQPKSYRKFIATAATATMVAGAVAPLATFAAETSFKDATGIYKTPVEYLVEKGFVNGVSKDEFGVSAKVKRGDAAVILSKALGLYATQAPDAGFTDLAAKYKDAVNPLKAAGIISGKTATEFKPDDFLTRGEVAIILAKAYKLEAKNQEALPFTDVNKNYAPFVKALVDNKVANGTTATTFGTASDITRGQMAIFLYNAINIEDKEAPVITLTGDAAVSVEYGAVYTDAGATAKDNKDEKVEVKWEIKDATGKVVDKIDTKVPGKYTVTYTAKDTAGNEAKSVTREVTVKEDPIAKVESVTGINATQVEVKFNTAVSKASLFTNGVSGAFKGTVTLTTIDGVPSGAVTGTLSADGKTLTITASNALSKRYDVVVDGLKSVDGKDITKYQQVITLAADTTAPVVVSTTKNSSSSFTVKFSEPLKVLGDVTYKLADGTVITGVNGVTNDFTAGAQEVTFTVGSDVAAGKEVIATFIGAQDQAGNLLTPNPATVSFVKGNKDGVAPTISSITQTGAKTFNVKFSEQLLSSPTVTVAGAAAASVEKDSTDPTVYKVTAAAALDGATTIGVTSFTDLSGEAGSDVSRVVTFVKDTAAPKVTSSNVVTDSTTGKQYLEFTFDKDVELNSATVDGTGSFVKDFVTTNIGAADLTPAALTYKDSNNKKVVRVELDTFLGTTTDVEGAAYTLNLTFSNVTNGAGIAADTSTVKFTRGKDQVAANTDLVSVDGVVQSTTNNSKVEVTFNKAVDGASATNVANYNIAGAVVESVTLLPVNSGKQVAVLNLKSGSNTFTGVRNINISGVKALGSSKVMDAYFTNSVVLKENVAPVVTSVKLTDTDKVTLTFSEAVTNATADNNDFELYIGGLKVAANDTVATPAITTGATSAVFTLEAPVTASDLSKGLSLKALDTIDIKDAAGNIVSVPSALTVAQ